LRYPIKAGNPFGFVLGCQAHSSAWQQTLIIHPNNNRGTETQQSTSDFDANGNLLALNNIGNSVVLLLSVLVSWLRVLL
jgi:hypothetical protein